MKTIRLIAALAFVSVLSSSFVRAEGAAATTTPGKKPAKDECGCATGADGKVCGVDKDCCCNGTKATHADAKKAEATPETKK